MKKKIVISEAMHAETKWYEEAKKQTVDTLGKFIDHIMNDYQHTYGTVCHAVAACAVAAATAAHHEPQGGITGFQASLVMWEFITHWNHEHNRTGMKLVDYDHMLFPQYRNEFTRHVISKETWEALQKEARRLARDDSEYASANVMGHWRSIADGVVPFGYDVEFSEEK